MSDKPREFWANCDLLSPCQTDVHRMPVVPKSSLDKANERIAEFESAIDGYKKSPISLALMKACQRNEAYLDRIENLRVALEFYADEKNWYLQKDPVTKAEVRRSIEYFDTESFGEINEIGDNILNVKGGKHARDAIAADDKARGE